MIDRQQVLDDWWRDKHRERKAKLVQCKSRKERILLVYGWIIQRVCEFNNFHKLIDFLIELEIDAKERGDVCQAS